MLALVWVELFLEVSSNPLYLLEYLLDGWLFLVEIKLDGLIRLIFEKGDCILIIDLLKILSNDAFNQLNARGVDVSLLD